MRYKIKIKREKQYAMISAFSALYLADLWRVRDEKEEKVENERGWLIVGKSFWVSVG